MKILRNLAAIFLLTTLAYSCDADATLDETQASVDQLQADGGDEEAPDEDGGGNVHNDPDVKE
ncbi:hypothetical protein MWU59_04560 [Flavobacteriaceae bacterium F08102]|nr:hypothetical protein [Flavobacteriaceae bacterium F08102]